MNDYMEQGISGKKVVVGILCIVLFVSTFAAWYGYNLRSETPHSEEDHPKAGAEEQDTGTRSEVEEHMRSIGYVQ
jgi:hypothetical protein